MKKLLCLVLLAALTLSLIPGAMAETQIRVWTFLDPNKTTDGRCQSLAKLIEMYETKYPGVKVVVEPQQWDTMSAKFFAAHMTGDAPDVIWINGADLGQAISLGTLEPFENLFMDEWTQEQKDDIDSVLFRYGATEDAHYQVHISADCFGILYRADLFEKAGIDPNFNSWEELEAAAAKLTFVDEATGMKVWGLGTGYLEENAAAFYLLAALLSQQGDFLDADGAAMWANDVGAAALQHQIDMIDTLGITPETALSSSSGDNVYTDFAAGKYAMAFGGTNRIPTIKSQCVFDSDAVKLMPYPDINGSTGKAAVSGWNVGVWSKSAHKEEAGRFVEMLASPEMDEVWVKTGIQVPIRKSTAAKLAEFLESDPAYAHLAVGADILNNHAFIYNADFNISGFKSDLARAMQLAYVNGVSVEDALSTTAAEFNDRNLD